MDKARNLPNIATASSIVTAMTGERVLSIVRMPTGEQNFVFAASTSDSEYVIRITDVDHKHKFCNAI